MSFRGSSSSSTGSPQGLKRGRTGALATNAFIFEYWSDRKFDAYGPAEQTALNDELAKDPRPDQVALPGGKYELHDFSEAHLGKAVQVNLATRFERTVRIKPPYRLPGANTAPLPVGDFRFQYFDNGWKSYAREVEKELQLFAQSAPPPSQIFFVTHGKAYWLLGMDKLAAGEQLMQMNVKTSMTRPVRMLAAAAAAPTPSLSGAYPASGAMSAPVAPPTSTFLGRSNGRGSGARRPPSMTSPGPSVGSCSRGFPSGSASSSTWSTSSAGSPPGSSTRPPRSFPGMSMRGRGGTGRWQPSWGANSGSSAGAATAAGSVSFAVCNADFRILSKPTGGAGGCMGGTYESLHEDACTVLLDAWRRRPRPESVRLPSEHVVEEFHLLELDGAGVRHPDTGMWMPIELHLPFPASGRVQLPEELDSDTAFDLTSCGCSLTNEQVAQLPVTNASSDRECAICRCELEVDNQGGNPVEEIFQLQCHHVYHRRCLEQWFNTRRRCPECQRDFGKVIGDQPRHGTMEWHTEPFPLAGHRAQETIIVQFDFPPGVSDSGDAYEGRRPKGYLPGNAQGAILLELFKVAFRRRVMFGLGNSMTSGTYRPTFNIHIKTSTHRGMVGHGYPDPEYFQRSLEELRTNGVTIDDLPE